MADLYDVHNARFAAPTAEEMDAFMAQQFGTNQDQHDPTNPEHVTRELMKPFPPSALYTRNNFTYVQFQQVIRRLIYATGNNYTTEVKELRVEPWAASNKGHQQVILLATVTLTIPVLKSSRTHTGVQVATVGFGEDMWKGAVSDGIKKAAQQFGVAIDLAGVDGEDTAPDAPPAPQRTAQARPPQQAQQAPPQAAQGQRAPMQPGTGGPATDGQKRALWAISGASKDQIDQWAAEYGESNQTLTKGTASVLIDTYGGNR